MRTLILVVCALAAFLGASSCATTDDALSVSSVIADTTRPAPPRTALHVPPLPVSIPPPRTLAKARQVRHELERRPPDRRFQGALEDIPYLARGATREPLEARLSEGRWYLVRRERAVCDVSEMPDFEELDGALVAWARTQLGEVSPPAALSPPNLAEPLSLDERARAELDSINVAWERGDHTPQMMARAAHVLTSVAFATFDELGTADALYTRAWAMSAMARARGAGRDSDLALLASALGYERSARAIAGRLGPDDPVRLYFGEDETRFEKIVGASDAPNGVRYLWFRRVLYSGDIERVTAAAKLMRRGTEISFLIALMSCNVFELHGDASDGAMEEVLADLSRRVTSLTAGGPEHPQPPLRPEPGRLFDDFDSLMSRFPPRARVPFELEVEQASYRALFQSAFVSEFYFQLVSRGAPEEALQVVARAGRPRGPSFDLYDWARSLAEQRRFKEPRTTIAMHQLLGWAWLGAAALAEWELNGRRGDRGSYEEGNWYRALERRLDSRPEHRDYDRRAIPVFLYSPEYWIDRLRQFVRTYPNEWSAATIAVWDGDWKVTENQAADIHLPALKRFAAVTAMVSAKHVTEAAGAAALLAITKEAGMPLHLVRELSEQLYDWGLWADLNSLVQPWLAAHPDTDSMAAAKLRGNLARALFSLGQPAEAWKAIEPALPRYIPSVEYEAANVLAALGRRKEAIEMAELLRSQSDGSNSNLRYMGIQWRLGNAKEAVKYAPQQIAAVDLRDWGSGILETVMQETRGRHVEPLLDAFRDGGFSESQLALFAEGLIRKHHPEWAFRLLRDRPPQEVVSAVVGYLALRDWKGEQEALRWFWKKFPTPDYAVIAITAATYKADGIILSFPDATIEQQPLPRQWVLVASAFVRTRATGERVDRFRTFLRDYPVPSGDLASARYLMGMIDENALREAWPAGTDQAVLGYYLGVGCEARGDWQGALEAYLDTVSLTTNAPERGWASTRLEDWTKANKPVKQLIDQPLTATAAAAIR